MNADAIWLIAGLLICAAEMLHPGVFLLWIGLAACGTGLVMMWLDLRFGLQVAVFIAFLTVLLAAPIARRRRQAPLPDPVNAPEAGLIGQTCRAAGFEGSEGRVFFRDASWKARSVDGGSPAEGALLRVVGLDGTTLLVRAFRDAEP